MKKVFSLAVFYYYCINHGFSYKTIKTLLDLNGFHMKEVKPSSYHDRGIITIDGIDHIVRYSWCKEVLS